MTYDRPDETTARAALAPTADPKLLHTPRGRQTDAGASAFRPPYRPALRPIRVTVTVFVGASPVFDVFQPLHTKRVVATGAGLLTGMDSVGFGEPWRPC